MTNHKLMLKERNNITEAIIQLQTISKKKKAARTKDEEGKVWRDASARTFLKGYGENEPDYTKADVKEPNPEYKKWNKVAI